MKDGDEQSAGERHKHASKSKTHLHLVPCRARSTARVILASMLHILIQGHGVDIAVVAFLPSPCCVQVSVLDLT